MIVLDANILIALFDPFDASHAVAERLLMEHADDHLMMSSLTMAEFLIRPTAEKMASRATTFIGNMGIIVAPLLDDDARHLARVRIESGLRMPDAVVLWLAQSSSAMLMTLDKRLAKAAEAMGVAVISEPVDLHVKPYLTRAELLTMPLADAKLKEDLSALGSVETDTVGPLT